MKKLIAVLFCLCTLSCVWGVNGLNAKTKTDGLIVNVDFTYASGTHSATGSSGKCTSNGVTHKYTCPGVKYQYYDVYHKGAKAYAHLRAKLGSGSYHTDSSTISF